MFLWCRNTSDGHSWTLGLCDLAPKIVLDMFVVQQCCLGSGFLVVQVFENQQQLDALLEQAY